MKRVVIAGVVASLASGVYAQVMVTNNGTHIEITQGAVFYVKGGVWIKNGGTINNDGQLYVTTHSGAGTEDWINDASPTALTGTGVVYLSADNTQFITGQFPTTFYDLVLDGNGNTVKALKGVDAYVANTLNLNDEILYVDTHVFYLLNSDPASLMRVGATSAPYTGAVNEGLVAASSANTKKGYFARVVTPGQTYLFPVGASTAADVGNNQDLFRPVEVEVQSLPGGANQDTFFVRLVDVDPTTDGYDRGRQDSTVRQVFDGWYIRAKGAIGGDREDVLRVFFDSTEFSPTGIVHWRLDRNALVDGQPPAWTTRSFASDSLDPMYYGAGLLASIENVFQFRYTSPGTDVFAIAHTQIPKEIPTELYIPNLFSPNGDGHNDYWMVFGPIEEIHIIIYDRWGNKIFETTDAQQQWDGTYKGKPVNSGIYAYYIRYKLTDGTEGTAQGYLVLTR